MSATQTVPTVVPVAPVVAVALVVPVAPVALVAPVAPVAPSHRPSRRPTKAHKNPDFVLEMPENGGSGGQKSTKTSILCSKVPKMGVSKAKSAQKPQFCAREARKRGVRRAKKHKNTDFVLEMPENVGSRPQKRTKIPIMCSGGRGLAPGREEISIGKRNRRDVYPSCKSPRTLLKCKYLITRQLTFINALGELKSRPPRGPMCPRGA